MPTGGCHRAHVPTLWRHSPGFRAARQAVLRLPTSTCNSGSQGAGQTRATMAWGRALVIPTGQPLATWQVTWGAVAITAASTTLMASTILEVAAFLFAPARTRNVVCRQMLALLTGSNTRTDLKRHKQAAHSCYAASLCWHEKTIAQHHITSCCASIATSCR